MMEHQSFIPSRGRSHLNRHGVAELAILRVVAGLEEEALVDAVSDVGRVEVAGLQVRALVRTGKRVLRCKESC